MKEISKTRRIIGWVLSVVPTAFLVFSGINKVFSHPIMVESLNKINLGAHIVTIGVIEIACVILYFIPKTSNIGFFLLCSYVGGIIAAEWAMGQAPIPGIAVAVLLYVGTMLRKPELSGLGI